MSEVKQRKQHTGALWLVCAVFLLFVHGCKDGSDFGKNVWMLSKKRIALKNNLPGKEWAKAVKFTRNWWGADFRRLGFGFHIVLPYKDIPPARRAIYMVVNIDPAPSSWYVPGKCEHIRPGDKRDTKRGFWSRLVPERGGTEQKTGRAILKGATLYVCTRKIEKALAMRETPLVEPLRKHGRKGVLLHETTQLFWRGHPKWLKGRGAEGSLEPGLSESGKRLLKQHVLPQLK